MKKFFGKHTLSITLSSLGTIVGGLMAAAIIANPVGAIVASAIALVWTGLLSAAIWKWGFGPATSDELELNNLNKGSGGTAQNLAQGASSFSDSTTKSNSNRIFCEMTKKKAVKFLKTHAGSAEHSL